MYVCSGFSKIFTILTAWPLHASVAIYSVMGIFYTITNQRCKLVVAIEIYVKCWKIGILCKLILLLLINRPLRCILQLSLKNVCMHWKLLHLIQKVKLHALNCNFCFHYFRIACYCTFYAWASFGWVCHPCCKCIKTLFISSWSYVSHEWERTNYWT